MAASAIPKRYKIDKTGKRGRSLETLKNFLHLIWKDLWLINRDIGKNPLWHNRIQIVKEFPSCPN